MDRAQEQEKKLRFSHGRVNWFLALLCAFAGFRIFLYGAAFPVFNPVDEQAHFDTVYKYASGPIPSRIEPFSRETADLIFTYKSPEYLLAPEDFPGKAIPQPPWSLKTGSAQDYALKRVKERVVEDLQAQPNIESTQPPLYYGLAALWYRLGKVFGLSRGSELYWIRFLNIPLYVVLIRLSFFFLKRFFPDDALLPFGVPLFLAVIPQSILCGMNNDVLSPLLFSLAFFGLVDISLSEEKSLSFYLLTGLVIALTMLTKISNLAVLAAFAVILALKAYRRKTGEKAQGEPVKISMLILGAALPIALWLGRNHFVLNDVTGSAEKIQHLGWTLKPFSDVWNHPFFTINGAITFWHELLASFWRGEFVWHKALLSSPAFDAFYSLSSLLLIGVVAASVVRTGKERTKERFVYLLSLLIIIVSVAFLLTVSLAFDFHDCWYPSRQHPFLASGRLMFGAIVPFLILYIAGFGCVMRKLRIQPFQKAILVLMAAAIAVSEFVITCPVFTSSYNWFHVVGILSR